MPPEVRAPRAQASSGLLLKPRQPDSEHDDSADEIRLAWKPWMKESINDAEGISCNVLNWWKAKSPSFPLIVKAANIVLATPASEAICKWFFKQAKHIGTTDRMTQLHIETFEMLVMPGSI